MTQKVIIIHCKRDTTYVAQCEQLVNLGGGCMDIHFTILLIFLLS